MGSIKTENLTFFYPESTSAAVSDVSLNIKSGEFVTICGKSGCGKTTLLRLLKPALSPHGRVSGERLFDNGGVLSLTEHECAQKIGFVMQNPDSQIVTDKVWHELAFGAESLGIPTAEIQRRIAETAAYFGIHTWFHKKTTELSGGQKQLLNLASVMVTNPEILILDEPTSRLDPLSASRFLSTVFEINRRFGTTVIISEHRLEEVLPVSDKVVVMEGGRIICCASPADVSQQIKKKNPEIFASFPTAARVAAEFSDDAPLTVRDGRLWLQNYLSNNTTEAVERTHRQAGSSVISAKNIWFRYKKEDNDILRGLSLSVGKGEIFSVVGGNGSGKTTLLTLLSSVNMPLRGTVKASGKLSLLPQNPQAFFIKSTMRDELLYVAKSDEEFREITSFCGLDGLLDRHPYDLSGGEQQRLALGKLLLTNPDIILLDEPTKGLDFYFKQSLADMLRGISQNGKTIVLVTHDIEFAASVSDRCAILFDGELVSEGTPEKVFCGGSFYTTTAAKIAEGLIPGALLTEDIIKALGKTPPTVAKAPQKEPSFPQIEENKKKASPSIAGGIFFTLIFVMLQFFTKGKQTKPYFDYFRQFFQIFSAFAAAACFVPKKRIEFSRGNSSKKYSPPSFEILTVAAAAATIFAGIYIFDDRKYYFISLLIIFEIMFFSALGFERSKPPAAELVLISVICAVAAGGRVAFAFLPQFKPLAAIVIISGISFGGKRGFFMGAMSAFLSNFFLGQGPWTPWQMFAFGMIGMISGAVSQRLLKTSFSVAVFGALAVLIIYGGIMNPASVFMMYSKPTAKMIAASFASGLPMDLIHSFATAFFLFLISEPMLKKFERIKAKFDIMK